MSALRGLQYLTGLLLLVAIAGSQSRLRGFATSLTALTVRSRDLHCFRRCLFRWESPF
ncbi:MAG UNVERIFIED_CONTAM: hypothetical protein LVR18_48440 [Planctomycetaceae bacterium]